MKKYMDINRIKPMYVSCFTKGEQVVFEEKVDGANASFNFIDGKLCCNSRRQDLNSENTLSGFYNWVMSLDEKKLFDIIGNRYIVFGEWLVKNKIKYPEDAYRKFYMFDVYDKETETYLTVDESVEFCNKLELTFVPIFYKGPFIDWEHVKEFVGKTEIGAEPCGEGIVVKTNDKYRLNDKSDRREPYIKYVSEHFSEVQKTKKPVSPEKLKQKEKELENVKIIVTKRRVEKQLEKMVQDNIIPEDWNTESMSIISKNITKLVYEDCIKEEPEFVKEIENFGKLCAKVSMEYTREILNERNDPENFVEKILKIDSFCKNLTNGGYRYI